MKVRFLTPYNKYEEMEYYDVLEYCKHIATLPMFKDDFEEFKKHYNYFTAYFDYVMFRLGYIMINPLFYEGYCATTFNNQFYCFYDESNDYDSIRNHLHGIAQMDSSYFLKASKVDDLTLQIEQQTTDIKRDTLITPDMISMMSKTTIGLSHVISGNTILNQLLIASKEVVEDYEKCFFDDDSSAVDYLVNKMGFIRLVSPQYVPLMIVNRRVSTLKQKMFFKTMESEQNYPICDTNEDVESSVKLYRKVLEQTKKEL